MSANWSGHPNGAIPLSLGVEFESTGKYLQADAARSLSALFDDIEKETGQRPYIAAGEDLYRDLAEQVALLHANYHVVLSGGAIVYGGQRWAQNTGIDPHTGRAYVTCATPGDSNHGTMIAADITLNAVTQASFRKHCAAHHWTNAGDAFGESWHKEYHGPMTTPADSGSTPIPKEDEEMATKIIKLQIEGESTFAAFTGFPKTVTLPGGSVGAAQLRAIDKINAVITAGGDTAQLSGEEFQAFTGLQ